MKRKRFRHDTLWLNHSPPCNDVRGGALLKGTTSRDCRGCLSVESTSSNGLFFATWQTEMWRPRKPRKNDKSSLNFLNLLNKQRGLPGHSHWNKAMNPTQTQFDRANKLTVAALLLILTPEKTNSAPGRGSLSLPLNRTQNSTARTITIRTRSLCILGQTRGASSGKTPGSGAGVFNGTELVRVAFNATWEFGQICVIGDWSCGIVNADVVEFIEAKDGRIMRQQWHRYDSVLVSLFTLLLSPRSSSMPCSSPATLTSFRPSGLAQVWPGTPQWAPVCSHRKCIRRRRRASRRCCGPGRCSTVWPATNSGSSKAPHWPWPSSLWSWRCSFLTGSRSSQICWKKHK